MPEKIKSYRDLLIWQKGIEIVKDVYLLSEKFPRQETYRLTSQIKRAAISVSSNIAEGFRRYYKKEYKQFLHISLSSCAELETQITIAKEEGFIDSSKEAFVIDKTEELSRMLMGLIKKLQ